MLQTPDRSTKVLLELADYMERLDPYLYCQQVYNSCCDRGCIAFQATRMLGIVISFNEVGERLGLEPRVWKQLFHADGGQRSVMGLIARGPTTQEAAQAIRHVAVTGEVPDWWTKFIPEDSRVREADAGHSGDVLHELEPVNVS